MPIKSKLTDRITHWKRDPISFITEVLRDPETNQPFRLYAEEETFLRTALTVTADGRLPYSELLFSAPKKSGKTGLAAMATLYVIVVLGGNFAEGYCVANDFEQASSRVFQAIARIIQASPLLCHSAKVTGNRIEFTSTGSTITAIANEYAGAAGSNPTITVFDELWGYTSERGLRLFDEMVPVPTRKVSVRLTVTYAGFEGESELLETLYKRALAGETVGTDLYRGGGMFAYWTHQCRAPWQTPEWREQMREQLRPNAYLRLIENRWVTSESTFVDMVWFDACTNPELSPELSNPSLPVWVGVDASVKRDSTAIAAATFENGKVRLVWHRIFQPSVEDPLDFENTIEKSLLDLCRRFYVKEIKYDPYQLVSVAQRLTQRGLPMVEFPQSVPNLTEASTNLYEAIKGRNLIAYHDTDIRLAMSRAVAIETGRGWRISKQVASHKIDIVIALAQAALGAVQMGQQDFTISYTPVATPPSVWDGHFAGDDSYSVSAAQRHRIEDNRARFTAVRWGKRWRNAGY
ncbi:MAG TPA: terminase TerL endonuclease subunit [Bryobacteraceae bacterium]|nr:terminase TerL endonuclease subunit [Bryobacteraceae bacterium]